VTEKKLAVIILDALDPYNIRRLGMPDIQKRVQEHNSGILGVSTLPHTAQSNPMIWGGFHNRDKYWVKEPEGEWTDPAQGFDRDKAETKNKGERVWARGDYSERFIWDHLHTSGVDSAALHIPITLPPYSFNVPDHMTDHDYWFPAKQENMEKHTEKMPEHVEELARDEGNRFIACSMQMPDKYVHGLAERKCTEQFLDRDSSKFSENVDEMLTVLEDEGYDWVVLGDHGNPTPGAIKLHNVKQLLPRHRKNSIIFGTVSDLPSYTDEVYKFMLDYFGVKELKLFQDT